LLFAIVSNYDNEQNQLWLPNIPAEKRDRKGQVYLFGTKKERDKKQAILKLQYLREKLSKNFNIFDIAFVSYPNIKGKRVMYVFLYDKKVYKVENYYGKESIRIFDYLENKLIKTFTDIQDVLDFFINKFGKKEDKDISNEEPKTQAERKEMLDKMLNESKPLSKADKKGQFYLFGNKKPKTKAEREKLLDEMLKNK